MKPENCNKYNYKQSLKKNGNRFIEKYIRVERYINRPLASLVVMAVYRTPITPNGLTYISFLLGLVSAALFATGNPYYFIWAGITIQLSAIVDCSDGMLARAKNMCSDYGSFLDLFLDRVTDFFLFVGISLGFYFYKGSVSMLIFGLIASGMYVLQISLFYLTKTFLGIRSRGETGELRALMLFIIFMLAIFNRLDIIVYCMVAETTLNTLGRIIYFIYLGKSHSLTSEPETVPQELRN